MFLAADGEQLISAKAEVACHPLLDTAEEREQQALQQRIAELEVKTAYAEGRLRGISSRLSALDGAGVAVVYCDEGLTPSEFGEPREPGKRQGLRPRP